MLGFLVMFIYFYVYAINYIRGVRADEVPDPVKTVQDFQDRVFLILIISIFQKNQQK